MLSLKGVTPVALFQYSHVNSFLCRFLVLTGVSHSKLTSFDVVASVVISVLLASFRYSVTGVPYSLPNSTSYSNIGFVLVPMLVLSSLKKEDTCASNILLTLTTPLFVLFG